MTARFPDQFTRTVLLAFVLPMLAAGCAASRNDKATLVQADTFNQSLAPAEMSNAALDAYFQTIGSRIVAAAKEADAMKIGPKSHFDGPTDWMFQDVHFYLVNSHTLNAFTTGGHAVYIYNELYQLCKNEDELAAVMSHEFAHIYCRHVQKGMTNQKWLAAGTLAAEGTGYVAGGSESGADYAKQGAAAMQFIGMGFTRSDEAQADHYGQIFYTLAGWDPAHFGEFFHVMKDKVGDVASDLTSDHPSLTSRYEIADKQSQALEARRPASPPPPVATQQQFVQYQQIAVQVSAQTPNDQQVLKTKQLLQALPRSCWIPVEQPDQDDAARALGLKPAATQQGN